MEGYKIWPTVIQYRLKPMEWVKLQKIVNLILHNKEDTTNRYPDIKDKDGSLLVPWEKSIVDQNKKAIKILWILNCW